MCASLNNTSEKGLYEGAESYVLSNPTVSWSGFERSLLNELRLFDVPDGSYLDSVEEMLDVILRALPHFEMIFARPIIRLKDEHRIVPIEAVKIIDKRSLTHLASRCELWEDITEEGIKPRKLMTVENVETYSIYENIVFACAVDSILSYIKQYTMIMKDVLYGCKDIHFNLLDRTHHSLYFLAIGKLYLEYVRSGVSLERWARCMDKMLHIEKTLCRRLNSPVYRYCKQRNYNIKLKKTNIFRSHKDYKEIYRVMSIFKNDDGKVESVGGISCETERYKSFCRLMTVFSVGHFNYSIGEISLGRLSFDATFYDWRLSVREVVGEGVDAIELITVKDKKYVTAVIFGSKKSIQTAELEKFKLEHPADEYLFCASDVYGDRDTLYLSILDVDSFRRVQQILLRGMIYSDMKRDRCAFCGEECDRTEDGYICRSCQAEISERLCGRTGRRYYASGLVSRYAHPERDRRVEERRRFLHDRYDEAQLHYRNITPINAKGELLCPFCGELHTDTNI